MSRKLQSLTVFLVTALPLILTLAPARAQEVAPALQFAPQPGTNRASVPPVIVLRSQLDALLVAPATPTTEVSSSPAETSVVPSSPIRVELQPAEEGSGDGFQFVDVTKRSASDAPTARNQVERDLAIQAFRRSLLSKTYPSPSTEDSAQ
jgi:hypothetical protein